MDHIPGPIIATVAPRPASIIAVSELPNDAKNIQTSTMAIVMPATGVQRPRRSSVPATMSTIAIYRQLCLAHVQICAH